MISVRKRESQQSQMNPSLLLKVFDKAVKKHSQ